MYSDWTVKVPIKHPGSVLIGPFHSVIMLVTLPAHINNITKNVIMGETRIFIPANILNAYGMFNKNRPSEYFSSEYFCRSAVFTIISGFVFLHYSFVVSNIFLPYCKF